MDLKDEVMKYGIVCLALLATMACASTIRPNPEQVLLDTTSETDERRCLKIAWIYKTIVFDNRTILFRMRDGSIWRNRLPMHCTGLAFQRGFAYEISIPKVCDSDLIRVLGPTSTVCKLGDFEPYAPSDGPGGNPMNAPAPGAPE